MNLIDYLPLIKVAYIIAVVAWGLTNNSSFETDDL